MKSVKLSNFRAPLQKRLGDLIRRARSNELTAAEEMEMLDLLKKATRVSKSNAESLRILRGGAPTVRQQRAVGKA